MQQLEIKTGIQVLKSATAVFESIVDPGKMNNYFISESSGFLKDGETLSWKFAEVEMAFEITAGKIINNQYISFYWDPAQDGNKTFVEITLLPVEKEVTYVTVTEKSKPANEAGIKWLKSNTEGWANFLACLKAWMEYGIHLRKGAFNPGLMEH